MKQSLQELLIYAFIATCTFFAPVAGLLISVGVAIGLDTLTGFMKIYKTGEKFSSKKFSNITSKFVLYQASILLIFIMDKYLLGEFFKIWFSIDYFFTKIMAIVLIFIEGSSIKENFEAAYTINIFNKLKEFLKRSKELKDEISNERNN